MPYPKNYRFTTEHEWVAAPAHGRARIGITDYAQHALGDIVFVELPAVGARLEAGQPLGTVESVKAVSEVFAPVSGAVTAVNPELGQHPEFVNQDPHGQGWMIELQLDQPSPAFETLMDAARYQAFIAEEETGAAPGKD